MLLRSHVILRAALTFAATSAIVLTATASPVQAHETPKPGSACAMSGMTEFVHGRTYVCLGTPTTSPKWSQGLPASRSPLVVADGWAKAAAAGEMSATFGRIVNSSSKPITVIAASSPYSEVLQLHEVVASNGSMVMQQKTGGFTIAPGSSFELKPGGNHIMFMKLTKPISAGAMIPVTLIASDGGRVRVWVLAKVFSGGNETYNGSMSGGMG